MVRMKILPGDEGLAYPRYVKSGKTKAKKSSDSHDELQDLAEQYLNALRIPFIHIPDSLLSFINAPYLGNALQKNESLYGWLMSVRNSISNYLCGVPDIIMFYENKFLCVEFKTGGAKQRKSQVKWAGKVPTIVCRDFESFKKNVDEWRSP